jgi:hypothetical protein
MPPSSPPGEARQFDFLIGQWALVATPRTTGLAARIHGSPKLAGTWKAWRGFDGWGIEDELRLTDASGNPLAFIHAVRVYGVTARHWTGSSLDVYRGVFGNTVGEWQDGQLVVTSHGTDADGKAFLTRSRYFEIQPNSFRFQQDRSYDEGRSWTEGQLKIEAKRTAAVAPR